MGKLEAIWLKRTRGGPMNPVGEAVAVERRGLEGGADFDRDRHVTLIEREVFDRYVAERIPLGREQTPEDIGNAATFLASDLASNITGQALNVSGGSHMN